MQQPNHTVGERSVVSPTMGRYAPPKPRLTETTEIVQQLETIAAPGKRVAKRTEKVYSLWERGGDRHERKSRDAAFASGVIDTRHDLIEKGNRRLAIVGIVAAAATAIAGMLWML